MATKKKYITKVEGEKDLFYDTKTGQYKYRMHCPRVKVKNRCGKPSGCRCFDTLEDAKNFILDGIEAPCSNKCAVLNIGLRDLEEIPDELGIRVSRKMSEENAKKVADAYYEMICDSGAECPAGKECRV